MGANDMPRAEVDVDPPLVRSLLAEQHPDLAERSVELVAHGWDNVLFRVGEDLVARLPRRAESVPLVEHEQRWLPELAPRLPLPVPAPVRVGRPGRDYPWPWSIVPWFEGSSALISPPEDPVTAAASLGSFLAALHEPAPVEAPVNPYRGIPLRDRQPLLDRHLTALGETVDAGAIRTAWEGLVDAPVAAGPGLWLHGDVHPGNLVVRDGRLVAVVDFGDLCAGDRASDLAVAWMLFDGPARLELRAAAGARRPIDDATWRRARAWALALGVAISANSADNPTYAGFGVRTIATALAGD